jgi:hypothetical protein
MHPQPADYYKHTVKNDALLLCEDEKIFLRFAVHFARKRLMEMLVLLVE